MKKVYGSIWNASWIIVCLILMISILYKTNASPETLKDIKILSGGLLLALLYFLRLIFWPIWTYDEKGLKFCISLPSMGRYDWTDVVRVGKTSNLWGTYMVYLKTNILGPEIGIFSTRNSSEVLSDVVRFIRERNPNADIDKKLLEKLGLG